MSQDEGVAAMEVENRQLRQQLEAALAQNRLLLERVQELYGVAPDSCRMACRAVSPWSDASMADAGGGQMQFVGWYPFEQRNTIGETGSENGIIQRDDEYRACARITLERDGHTPFAVTCGIYGWMVHTRFFATEQEANEAFGAMKVALARIVDLIPSPADPQANERSSVAAEEMHAFIEEFP